MSTFVSNVNPVTGKADWILQDENYDYHQEIARSAFADMLHDSERNKKYYAGVKRAVRLMHQRGHSARVLDIGTGTGLLSMMAVAAGADTVTACEAFAPMAECARKILSSNGCGHVVLIGKRSTELKVGPDGDMKERANILVTEVFDTELIGEGAIGTFNHAHQHLLENDCLVIPRAANLYAQPVCSRLVQRWNKINTSLTGINVPPAMDVCSGALSLHDLQLDQLSNRQFTALSDPLPVFRFDFTSKEGLQVSRRCEKRVEARVTGPVDAVFTWWDCEMDPAGEITLSCAPRWAHPDGDRLQWRDHWMQAIYYPSQSLTVTAGSCFKLHCAHDEYSLSFDASTGSSEMVGDAVCRCGVHTTLSRSRIGMLGDPERLAYHQHVIEKLVPAGCVCLCISDSSLLPLLLAKLQPAKVFTLEPNSMYRRITESFVEHNSTCDVTVLDKPAEELSAADLGNQKIDRVLGEPYFASSLLPWHNIHLWYAAARLPPDLLAPGARVLPDTLHIRAVAMQFDHLWKIRAPVGNCEGFDLTEFDRLIEKSAAVSDSSVEAQPLWEYPGTALSGAVKLVTLRPSSLQQPLSVSSQLHMQVEGTLNGVALWADFGCSAEGEEHTWRGVRGDVRAGEGVDWDLYTRQGVHLLPLPLHVSPSHTFTVSLHFNPDTGQFDFNFHT